jgi:FixJ family two-component response regulator
MAVREYSAMDMIDDYTAQDLSARQREVMKLIVQGLSNKEIASILNLAEGLTAKECLQTAEVCLALAHKTKELDTRAALLECNHPLKAAGMTGYVCTPRASPAGIPSRRR